jgi:hypothetical protein
VVPNQGFFNLQFYTIAKCAVVNTFVNESEIEKITLKYVRRFPYGSARMDRLQKMPDMLTCRH